MAQPRVTDDRFLSSAEIVLEELKKREQLEPRRVALHLLGVAICLENRAEDYAPRLQASRMQTAQQLRALALEVGKVEAGQLDNKLMRAVGGLVRSVLATRTPPTRAPSEPPRSDRGELACFV